MKNTLIAIIIALVATVAFLCGKLSNTTNGFHAEEPKSAVTDTVKVDTLSFEQKLAMADSIRASKKNVSYIIKYEKDFWNNEGVFGYNTVIDKKGVHQEESGTRFLSSITKYRNGLPELAIQWIYSDKRYAPIGLVYFSDEGKRVAASSNWVTSNKYRWYCEENASEHTSTDGITYSYQFLVEDPRVCINIK